MNTSWQNWPAPDATELRPLVARYLAGRPFFFAFIRPQEAWLFRHAHTHLHAPLLDFGCGDGFFARSAFPSPIHAGLDLPGSRINEARATGLYERLDTYDGGRIPHPDNAFCTVVSNSVLEHLAEPQESLAEIFRVLEPGGCLLATVMTSHWENYLAGNGLFGNAYRRFMRRKQRHLCLPAPEDWIKKMGESGFTVEASISYLPPSTARMLHIAHYLAAPSLLWRALTGSWAPVSGWYKPFGIDRTISRWLSRRFFAADLTGAGLFVAARKGS